MYSIGRTVSNIAITLCGDGWQLDLGGSLGTLEINRILYVSCTSGKKVSHSRKLGKFLKKIKITLMPSPFDLFHFSI